MTTATLTTATGASDALILKRYAAEVLVEVTRPAIGLARGDRLVVAAHRVRES